MPIEKKSFLGGLNSDVEDRLVPQGDYRYALNIRASKSDGSNEGAIENTKGNEIVSFSLGGGTHRCIGAYDDILNNKVYYFVYSSWSEHSLLEYDVNNNSIVKVVSGLFLNFSENDLILEQNIAVIDGLMYWLQTNLSPKKINIEKAKSGEIGYNEINIQAVKPAPKYPPQNVMFQNDFDVNPTNSIKTNSVRNKLFQFRYKYIYQDNEESAWSAISKVALPVDEAQYRPNGYYPTENNNLISVDLDLGSSDVKRVQLAAREGNLGDFYLIKDIDKSKLPDGQQSGYTYKFYNNEAYLAIDNVGSDGMRLFDWFPLLANAQSLIDENKIVYSGITEGFDPVDVDITITPKYGEMAVVSPIIVNQLTSTQTVMTNQDTFDNSFPIWQNPNLLYIATPSSIYGFNSAGVYYYIRAAATANDVFSSFFLSLGTVDVVIFSQDPESTSNAKAVTTRLMNHVNFTGVVSAGMRFTIDVTVKYFNYATSSEVTKIMKIQYLSVVGDDIFSVANSLKTLINSYTYSDYYVRIKGFAYVGNSFPTAQLYYTMQVNYVQAGVLSGYSVWFTIPPSLNTLLSPSEQYPVASSVPCVIAMSSTVHAYAGWTTNVEKSLKQGASHGLGIVYYDFANRSGLVNTTQEKLFYVTHPTERAIASGFLSTEVSVDLKIKHVAPEGFTHYQIVYTGNQTIERYDVTEGYKGFIQCKLNNVTAGSALGTLTATLNELDLYNSETPELCDLAYNFTKGDRIRFVMDASGNHLQSYVDVEVISFVAPDVLTFKEPTAFQVQTGFLVEIYTPKTKTEKPFYYEVGEAYPIVDGQHYGDTNQVVVNGVSITPALINLKDLGDVYLRYRTTPVLRQIEDYNYSDFYDSDTWDKGRPNIVDDNIKRIYRPTTCRFSQSYIPETNINGLSTFHDFDFIFYNQKYGDIMLTYPEQKSLLVFQKLKVGRVGIQENVMYGNDGTEIGTVRNESRVLSDIQYYAGEYGIGNHPESFAVYGNDKFFTDEKRGSVLMLSNNGINPISEFNMHNYFNDILEKLDNGVSPYRMLGVFDVRFGEYILHLTNQLSTSLLSDTDIAPSALEDVISETIAFSNAKNKWTTFYSYAPEFIVSNRVGLISFKDGQLYKHNSNSLYNNFYSVQHSTTLRFLSNIEPSKIKFYNAISLEASHAFSVPSIVNQFGQSSSLIADDFTDEEGVWRASFLRDENTPNVTNPLFEGDEMRCHSMDITIENNDTELVTIFNVGINLNSSELTDR